jgi:hypothetical protein
VKKLLNIDILLPIILLSAFLILLIFNSLKLNFSFSEIGETQHYQTFLSIFTVLPVLFLLCSKYFWQISWHRKVLLIGVAMLMLSILYSERYFINNTYVFVGCTLFFFAFERKLHKPKIIYILFAVYFLWNAVSYFWAIDLFEYNVVIARYLTFLIIPPAFCLFNLTKKEINLLLHIFFRAVLIWLFISLCCWVLESRFFNLHFGDWFVLHKQVLALRSPFDIVYAWTNYHQPTFTAFMYLSAMFFGLYFWKTKAEFRPNIFELIVFALSSLLIILTTQSRLGFVLFVLILVIFYLSFFLKKRKALIINISLLAICGIIFVIFFNQKTGEIFSDEVRNGIYDTSFLYIKKHFLTGCGLGAMPNVFAATPCEIAVALYNNIPIIAYHAHNQFLGDFVQTGIIGGILIFSITIFLIYFSIKNKNWLLFGFFILFLILMQVEMPLVIAKGISIFVLFICLLTSYNINEKNSGYHNGSQR